MGNVYLGDKKVTSKGWYLGDAPLFDAPAFPNIDDILPDPYVTEDCHVFVANENAVRLAVPNGTTPTFVAVDGVKMDYETDVIGNVFEGSIIHAIFDWNNGVGMFQNWYSDILQFGLNSVTGKRNQLKSGYSAFRNIEANSAAISNLDTSNLTDMKWMFYEVSSLNADISKWNTSKVTNMYGMFSYASSFNQDLSEWCVSLIKTEPNAFASNPMENQPAKHPKWGTCPRGEDG